jgi:peptidoglycan/xylan/chitin deacetylase (PgdA/CDA1 family)
MTSLRGSHLKSAAKALSRRVSGRWVAGAPGSRTVVLCYHSVHPSLSFASATPATFARHLDWLVRTCDVIPLAEALRPERRPARSRPAVALTFDDGYLDNFKFAFPLLLSRGLPATFFVIAGFIDRQASVMERQQTLRRAGPDKVQPLEWDHLRAMRDGGMEIGAHTYSHPNLAALSEDKARDELTRSKCLIEDRLEQPVRRMAYPFGKPNCHFTRRTVALVEEAGYEAACAVVFRAVRPGDSPFAIPRLFVTRDSVAGLRDKVLGAWDLVGWWQERCPLWLARTVSPADFIE